MKQEMKKKILSLKYFNLKINSLLKFLSGWVITDSSLDLLIEDASEVRQH